MCKEQYDLQILYYDHDFSKEKFSIQMCRCCFLKPQVILSLDEYNKIDPIDFIESHDSSIKEFAPEWEGHCDLSCDLNSRVKTVLLGLSYACNLKCYHCFHNNHKDLPLLKETYLNTLYKLKGHNLEEISPSTSGEEFIYYNEVRDWLKTLTPKDVKKIKHQTNLTLLNRERILELKQISDETEVNYFFMPSIDGITKETYEATRIGGKFAKITENLRLLCDIFTPKNAVVLFTIKKPNMSDAKQVEDYFKINFGLKSSISFDVYDKECERVYNSIFRKGIELPSSKGYNFKIKKESGKYLTIITKKPLSKENIAKYSKYEFIEIHSYCGKNGKNLPKNIKYFKKTDNIFYIESLKQKNKYILFLDDISNLKIDNPKILEYFLSKTKESFLFINYDKKTIINSKLSIPLINREIYSDLLSFFNPKTSIFWSQILIGEQVLISKYNFIEVPNNVMCLNVSQKKLTKFLKKWKKYYGILPYSE